MRLPGSVPGSRGRILHHQGAGWGYGFVLGARAELDDGWTLGLSYHSEVHHTLSGPWTFQIDSVGLGAAIRSATTLLSNTRAKAKLTTPGDIQFGLRKQFAEDWTIWPAPTGPIGRVFKDFTAVAANPVQPNDVTVANWKGSWLVSLGAEYAASDDITLRAGTALDQTPAPSATLETRVPDATRTWLAVGVTWHATPALDLKLSYGHLFNDTRTVNQTAAMTGNALRGTLIGTTKSMWTWSACRWTIAGNRRSGQAAR